MTMITYKTEAKFPPKEDCSLPVMTGLPLFKEGLHPVIRFIVSFFRRRMNDKSNKMSRYNKLAELAVRWFGARNYGRERIEQSKWGNRRAYMKSVLKNPLQS